MNDQDYEVPRELPSLELARVLRNDVRTIFNARDNAQTIHATKEIDAAGNEVESIVRKVLTRHLPHAYQVRHGHVVDAGYRTSMQLDTIISDRIETPTLVDTEQGATLRCRLRPPGAEERVCEAIKHG